MAVVTGKSDLITDTFDADSTRPAPQRAHGTPRYAIGTVPDANGDSDTSK